MYPKKVLIPKTYLATNQYLPLRFDKEVKYNSKMFGIKDI